MPNVKSAKKRIQTNLRDNLKNKHYKSMIKTEVKKVEQAVEARDKEAATKLLKSAVKTINKVASKGIIHKKTAARKESKLVKKVNKLDN